MSTRRGKRLVSRTYTSVGQTVPGGDVSIEAVPGRQLSAGRTVRSPKDQQNVVGSVNVV